MMGVISLGHTGRCFDVALDEFVRLVEERRERRWNNEYKLVHGICRSNDGHLFAHAWLETIDHVWDFGIVQEGEHRGCLAMFSVEKPLYYREKPVVESIEYTWDHAQRMNQIFNNFGPWLPRYRELCKNGGKR